MTDKEIFDFIKRHPSVFEKDSDLDVMQDSSVSSKLEWLIKEIERGKRASRKRVLQKIALAAVPALAVFVFMITPVGQVFAQNAYKTLVFWAKDENTVTLVQDDGMVDNSFDEAITEKAYPSFEEVRMDYPFCLAEHTGQMPDKLTVEEVGQDEVDVRACYEYAGKMYTIAHHISLQPSSSSTVVTVESGKKVDMEISGIPVVGFVDDEGNGVVRALYDTTTLSIYAENISYDEFVKFLEGVVIK